MRFVTFVPETGEIKSASSGPAESHLQNLEPGLKVGDAGEFYQEGALKNYVFCPNLDQTEGTSVVKGSVHRKPKEEWDLAAEEEERKRSEIMNRFHHLQLADIDHIDVYLITPVAFSRLQEDKSTFPCRVEDRELPVSLQRIVNSTIPFHFEFGGYAAPLRQTILKFTLSGKEEFLQCSVKSFLGVNPKGFDVFTSHVVQSECLRYSIRVANHVIEAYRLAFDDPAARPIGIADAISAAMVVVLTDGYSSVFHTGNPYESKMQLRNLQQWEVADTANRRMLMSAILIKKSPPFLPLAVSSLKTAHLYGQYRECIVWAGTIMSNIIEGILLDKLPKTSPEYKQLKNEGSKVAGQVKRNAYFKIATGQTLKEHLDNTVASHQGFNESMYWNNLSEYVEKVLNQRNLLLHRKKAITSKDADDGYYTCMNFIYAIERKTPYSVLYSRDFNLKLSEPLL